jgi:hypothetical protein
VKTVGIIAKHHHNDADPSSSNSSRGSSNDKGCISTPIRPAWSARKQVPKPRSMMVDLLIVLGDQDPAERRAAHRKP